MATTYYTLSAVNTKQPDKPVEDVLASAINYAFGAYGVDNFFNPDKEKVWASRNRDNKTYLVKVTLEVVEDDING